MDAYYRKKIVEYANVFENERNDMEKSISLNNQVFSLVNNKTLSFENNLMPEFLITESEKNLNFNPSPAFQNKVQILLLFKGKTLEEIYEALEQEGSLFAQKCAAIMRTRDQNLLRANLHLVRKGVNSTFSECLMNEHKVMNLLVSQPHISPRLFAKSCRASNLFDPSFDPAMCVPSPDDCRKCPFKSNCSLCPDRPSAFHRV